MMTENEIMKSVNDNIKKDPNFLSSLLWNEVDDKTLGELCQDSSGRCGEEYDSHYTVFHFAKYPEFHFKVVGSYSSWDGTDYSYCDGIFSVEEKEITIKQWVRKP